MFLSKRLGDITANDIASMLPLFFVICGVIILVSVLILKSKDKENDNEPIRTATAKIVDKDQLAANAITIVGWSMFETEEGERVRVSVKAGHDYLMGDKGKLTWQGSRFISFDREK